MNPSCGKRFTPGHYGDRQKVCTGSAVVQCPTCKGTGKKDHATCDRCSGKKRIVQLCRDWYKGYLAQTEGVPRGVPQEAYERILRSVRDIPLMHTLIIVARESGMRKGELLGLTWGDILEPSGAVRRTVALRGQWDDRAGFKPTKTGAARPAFLFDRSRRALADYRKWYTVNHKGEGLESRVFPISESAAWRRWVDLQTALGISNPETQNPYRFHDIRHAVGTEIVGAGRLDLAQKVLGHKNVNTTMKYAKRRPDEILADVESLRKKKRKRRDGKK